MHETFADRTDAAHRLATALRDLDLESPIVLGIPRGGVILSAVVAQTLGIEQGVVVARKLRAPRQPELAIGAVTPDGALCLDEELARTSGADGRYLAEEKAYQIAEARRRERIFGHFAHPRIDNRTAIVIDDGLATGATAVAALRSMRNRQPARLIFAAPVGSPFAVDLLQPETDDILCLIIDASFHSVGQYYDDFRAVTDAEVLALLGLTEG
jgi:predicted phosphoribosyltransferase